MIVRRRNDTSICVEQTEHARLSEVLYESFTEPLEPVRTAVRHHDDGWSESDDSPPVEDGEILDYRSIPLPEHLEILQRSVDRCADRHPYAGLLVSKHGCSFHEDKTGSRVETFLENQESFRQKLSQTLDERFQRRTDRDFDWLQFTDAVSLFVLDPWSSSLEWNRDIPGTVTLRRKNPESFLVQGDGLPEKTLTLDYRYREVLEEDSRSEPDVRRRLARADEKTDRLRLEVNSS